MTANDEQFPGTVDAAIELVTSRLSDDTRTWLRPFTGDEIDLRLRLAAGLTPGTNVRAVLGLWGENDELLAQLPPSDRHPDDASSFFLIECWHRLRVERK